MAYAWALAGGQLLAGAVALAKASSFFVPGWLRRVLVPPAVASFCAALPVFVLAGFAGVLPSEARLFLGTLAYAVSGLLMFRWLFPEILADVLRRLPGGPWLQGWLRLSPTTAEQ